MRSITRFMLVAALALASGSTYVVVRGQVLTYTRGQSISAAYEGWEVDADGSKYFLFGYMNKNWEEEIDVPVGTENYFEPGQADRGQPTHFFPRRNRYVFRVPVPSNFTDQDELVWTLTTHGSTSKAYASLRADLVMDAIAKANDTGSAGMSSSPETRANKPPVLDIEGPNTRTVRVGQPLVLVARVTDDGVPKPDTEEDATRSTRRNAATAQNAGDGSAAASPETPQRDIWRQPPSLGSVRKSDGLHLSWFHYRGPGSVRFAPRQIKTWEDLRVGANSPWAPVWFAPPLPIDGRVTTSVTFDAPGTYVLRARADDGPATTDGDVTVTVTP